MGRVRDALAILTHRRNHTGNPSASWGWRGGFVGNGPRFDGSKIRSSLRSLYPSGYDLDSWALRARSRVAYWDSPQARALLQRLADHVIGTGLTLRAAPAWELIGSTLDDEGRRKLADEIDVRFRLWAESHEPDATGRRTLAEMQGFVFANELRDGDIPTILRYSGDSSRMSPLNLQILDADQLDPRITTYGMTDRVGLAPGAQPGNVLMDGCELTPSGALVAIYVIDPAKPYGKPTRIPMTGPSGRRFVLLPSIIDLPGQVRGVGPLAPIVHELQKITDYTAAEIEAAVSNALVAGMIEPSAESDTRTNLSKALGGGVQPRATQTGVTAPAGASDLTGSEVRIDKPGLWVGSLKAGEKLTSFDTKRPNVNFGTFVSTITKSISASLSIPVEVLEMTFSANYSASRASIILFWQRVTNWRAHIVSQLLAPVYESWLREEVSLGRFPILRANGFGADPVRTRAWLQAEWIGDPMPSIDPLKDAEADDLRIAQGATTGERVALEYNRSDFYENAAKRKAELAVMPQTLTLVKQPKPALPASDDPENNPPIPPRGGTN
jgi:lambda family phage portal protein